MRARNVHEAENIDNLIRNDAWLTEARAGIAEGDVYIVRAVLDKSLLSNIRSYLTTVGGSSLPNYHPIAVGAPNSHRLNKWDPRSYVRGCFHQFVFYPWNEDAFGLFALSRAVYQLKNSLGGLDPDRFLAPTPDDGCIARIAFQYYPAGGGALNKHTDPVDYHQLTVPTTLLSAKGESFAQGGAYAILQNGEQLMLDDLIDPGDVVFFNASVEHGVAPVDPDVPMNWLDFRGRWMMLFSVNRLADNAGIGNSTDLG